MVSTAQYFLPGLLAVFRRAHEAIEIRLILGDRTELVRMLQGNELDIAIMGSPPKELATRAEPFAAHPHVFVAPIDHPLTRREISNVESLRQHAFIVRKPGSGTRAAMEKFFSDALLEPRVTMEVPSNEAIKQVVIAGIGLSFLSLHTLALELEHGKIALLEVPGTPVIRAWNCVHTLSKVLSPAAEAFRYFVIENGEAHLASKFGKYNALHVSSGNSAPFAASECRPETGPA